MSDNDLVARLVQTQSQSKIVNYLLADAAKEIASLRATIEQIKGELHVIQQELWRDK